MISTLRRIAGLSAGLSALALFTLMSGCGGGSSQSNSDPPTVSTSSSGSSSSSSSSGSSSSSSSSSSSGSSSSSSSSSSSGAGAGTDVLTYHNDTMRSGQNLTESTLSPQNVNAQSFGLLRMLAADGPVDAAPLIASNVLIGSSLHNVIYIASELDSLYAYDADSGALLAQVSLLGSGESPSDTRSCNQVQPQIGITATPVIVRSLGPNGTLFVVAMSKDSNGSYIQRLHALDLATLADRLPAVSIQASSPGSGPNSTQGLLSFQPGQYKERGALLAANAQIYTVWASNCDLTPYNGWILAYSQSTLAQSAVLNYTPNGTQGAIWDVAGLAADSAGVLYGLAGNGSFDSTLDAAGLPSHADYGNAAIKVLAGPSSLSITDYFASPNTVSESASDIDLGSGSPLLLPDLSDASGATRHLMIGAGKDGTLLLLDRDNMGHFSPTTPQAYQRLIGALPGGLYSAFAYFNASLYVADVGGSLKAFALSQARLPASPTSQSSASFPYPGSSPAVSANATSDAIVWAVSSSSSAPAVLHAYNPANLAQEYYNSTQAPNHRDAFGDGQKFITPVIANGKVFLGTPKGVAVFGLL